MTRYFTSRTPIISLAVLASALMAGCNFDRQSTEGGISGTGFIIGPLELQSSARSLTDNPDSVTVRGRTFDTSSASFTVPTGLSALADGMVVRVDGNWGSTTRGNATRLVYNDTLRGPVSNATIDNRGVGTLTVAGQTVEITSDTRITGEITRSALQDLNSGSMRVSGWRSGNSESIRASWVKYSDAVDAFDDAEVEGVIQNLDPGNRTFDINGLSVSYSDATEVDDGLTLSNGTRVEVTGTLDGGTLTATEIERDDASRLYRGDDDDDTEIEGPIATLSAASGESSGSMTVNGVEVTWSSLSVFDDELTHDQLRVGLPVEVEGTWRNGKLVAEEIELGDGLAEISGKIDSKNGRQLTIGGVTVDVPTFARITDDDNDDQTLELTDLRAGNAGDYVEVEGIYQENGDGTPSIEALVIEREDDDDAEFELRAPVTSIGGSQNDDSITVLGITIIVNAGTEFEDIRFDDISVDDVLEVTYTRSGDQWIAEEIEKDD